MFIHIKKSKLLLYSLNNSKKYSSNGNLTYEKDLYYMYDDRSTDYFWNWLYINYYIICLINFFYHSFVSWFDE